MFFSEGGGLHLVLSFSERTKPGWILLSLTNNFVTDACVSDCLLRKAVMVVVNECVSCIYGTAV